MEAQVLQAIQDYQLVPAGSRVLVAVSGGADSVALLHLLHSFSSRLNFSLLVAHLDHGLRPDSLSDAVFVARLCRDLGLPAVFLYCNIAQRAGTSAAGLEEAGRNVRYAFLQQTARRYGCKRIALAHHRNDQAETVLMRLLRGSAVSGLAAMRPRSERLIRPLLGVSRSQIEAYLKEQSRPWVEDDSNTDRCFLRNRIRHDVLPFLDELWPQLDVRLATLAGRVAEEEDYWDGEVDRWLRCCDGGSVLSATQITLPLKPLLGLHPALRNRVLRRVGGMIANHPSPMLARHYSVLIRFLEEAPVQAELNLPGIWVAKRYDELLLRSTAPKPFPDYQLQIEGAGRYLLPDGCCLLVEPASVATGDCARGIDLYGPTLQWPLTVRTFQPGDRLAPQGMRGHKKVKMLFQELRIPLEERSRVPLLFSGEQLLWVVGIRRSRLACPPRDGRDGEAVWRVDFQPAFSGS
ncbi:MAG: tRNA lysidine(34) synthetase TilS [Desulfuromonadaceae bacterium]|nr:tRNA lysidine(34) synthetase TilS [Desulfuromonadaceae bacterium]